MSEQYTVHVKSQGIPYQYHFRSYLFSKKTSCLIDVKTGVLKGKLDLTPAMQLPINVTNLIK